MPRGVPTRATGEISRSCWWARQRAFDSLRDRRPPRRTRKPLSMGAPVFGCRFEMKPATSRDRGWATGTGDGLGRFAVSGGCVFPPEPNSMPAPSAAAAWLPTAAHRQPVCSPVCGPRHLPSASHLLLALRARPKPKPSPRTDCPSLPATRFCYTHAASAAFPGPLPSGQVPAPSFHPAAHVPLSGRDCRGRCQS